MENCTNISSPLSGNTWPVNITSLTYANINGNDYLYIAATGYANWGNTTMLQCALDSSNGDITSCAPISNAIFPGQYFGADTTINIDTTNSSNIIGYITSGTNVVACIINSDGSFNAGSCSSADITGQGIGWGSTLYNSTLYSVGQMAGMFWYSCSVGVGSVSCSSIPLISSSTWYLGIAISSNGNIYLSENWTYGNSSSANGLFALSNVSSLTPLTNAISDNSYSGTTPLTMLFDSVNGGNNNYIYISDYLSGYVYACAVNSSSGQFSGCSAM